MTVSSSPHFDFLILGGGPAGLTAALYLHRFKKDVAVLAVDGGVLQNNPDLVIHNYFGSGVIAGKSLIQRTRRQLRSLGVPLLKGEVLNLEIQEDETFLIHTANKTIHANNVILALGLKRDAPAIPHLSDYLGKGVSYCAVCDGFFTQDQAIGIVGKGQSLKEELKVLELYTKQITIFTPEVDNYPYPVVNEPILALQGQDTLEGVTTASQFYPLTSLFVAWGTPGGLELSKKVGIITNNKNELIVNEHYQTNITHLYAIGDMIPGIKQITKAIADAMTLSYWLASQND
jgi:thioredoxin reductase (NADPH)